MTSKYSKRYYKILNTEGENIMNKLKFVILLIILGILASCAVNKQKYTILTPAEFEKEITKYKNTDNQWSIYKRYILVPELEKINMDSPSSGKDGSLLAETFMLLRKNKLEELKILIDNSDDTNELELCWGLYYFYIEDYSQALEYLNKSKSTSSYKYLNLLLIADATLERDNIAYNKGFRLYQKVLDATDNEAEKDVIRIRAKLLRYGG